MATPSGPKRPAPDQRRFEARFIASINGNLADADDDDVMDTDKLER